MTAARIQQKSNVVYSMLINAPIVCVILFVWSLFCCAILCVLFVFAIISLGKRELVALL